MVRLAMDTATSDTRAVEFTPGSQGDSPVLPELPDQIPECEEIDAVTADGAYDTRRRHTAIIDRQTAEIQIRVARRRRGKGLSCPRRELRINARRRSQGAAHPSNRVAPRRFSSIGLVRIAA